MTATVEDFATHGSDLLAHETHHKVGQVMAEYHAADQCLIVRPVEYVIHRDTANNVLHEIQCALFELKSRTPLSDPKQTSCLSSGVGGSSVWVAISIGFIAGLLVALLR